MSGSELEEPFLHSIQAFSWAARGPDQTRFIKRQSGAYQLVILALVRLGPTAAHRPLLSWTLSHIKKTVCALAVISNNTVLWWEANGTGRALFLN